MVPSRRIWQGQVHLLDIRLFDHRDSTAADAVLTTHTGLSLHGHGTARRNPRDLDVPLVGQEIAAARALACIAEQLAAITAAQLSAGQGPWPRVLRGAGAHGGTGGRDRLARRPEEVPMTVQPSQSATTKASLPAPRRPRDLFEMLLGRWPALEAAWPFEEGETGVGMPIRVEEVIDNDQLVIRAELPGVDPEKDIEVTVDEGHLLITAERRAKAEERSERGYRSEFRYGTFSRRVRLPEGATAEVVSASYRDGVLEVRMPAPIKAAPARRIPVDRG